MKHHETAKKLSFGETVMACCMVVVFIIILCFATGIFRYFPLFWAGFKFKAITMAIYSKMLAVLGLLRISHNLGNRYVHKIANVLIFWIIFHYAIGMPYLYELDSQENFKAFFNQMSTMKLYEFEEYSELDPWSFDAFLKVLMGLAGGLFVFMAAGSALQKSEESDISDSDKTP